MRFVTFSIALLAVATTATAPARAETSTFIGVDTVESETELTYANGDETYEFEHLRLRFGWESDAGGSFGFEILSGDRDDTRDLFGTPYELETETAYGFYATLGKPVYVKLGWSRWLAIYTNLDTDVPDTETVDSFEIGIGANLSLGRSATFYADYTLRDTDTEFPKHLEDGGFLQYESVLVSIGVNVVF